MRLATITPEIGRHYGVYGPILKRLGTKAGLLFCNLAWWTGCQTNKEGWIYKSSQDIEDELGLTYREQRAAREVLRSHGLLLEHNDRKNHVLFFKIDQDAFVKWWHEEAPNEQLTKEKEPQSSDSKEAGLLQNVTSSYNAYRLQLNDPPPKAAQKAEPKKPAYDPRKAPMPKNLDNPKFKDLWQNWCEYRQSIKKPLTEHAVAIQLRNLAQWGMQSAVISIENSIACGYQGLFAPKPADLKARSLPPRDISRPTTGNF